MELDELKDLVGKIRDREEAERAEAERAKAESVEEWNGRLSEWNGKVREWLANLNWLAENGFRFTTRTDKAYHGVSDEQTLCSGSAYHDFGLIEEACMNGSYRYMGIRGGASSNYISILTDGNEWWAQNLYDGSSERRQLYTGEIKDVLANYGGMKNYLERFEEKYERLIERIRHRAGVTD